jgi:ketosteroid isomerase-like protein
MTMSSNAARAATLERALRAGVDGDREALRALFTDDVRAWTPALSTSSLNELIEALDLRDDAFSDIELVVSSLDVGGDYACAEWSVEMTHYGRVVLGEQGVEPTGTRVSLHGITVAEFLGDRICALRQYWDEFSMFEQIGLSAHGQESP